EVRRRILTYGTRLSGIKAGLFGNKDIKPRVRAFCPKFYSNKNWQGTGNPQHGQLEIHLLDFKCLHYVLLPITLPIFLITLTAFINYKHT
ncbi:MAG: hypothetical protein ABF455_03075, partial [Liquorilactobacillus satsumensis]